METNNKINSIGIFCGSSKGNNPKIIEAAQQLAIAMVTRRISLVYGGAKVGIMGVIADAMLEAGGEVIGVIPNFLCKKEIAHESIAELHVVDSLTERKELIAKLADAFIMLPGGYGSLDEFFEMVIALKLGLHAKPCAILNVDNYFDSLIRFIAHSIEQRFIEPHHRNLILVENSADRLLTLLTQSDVKVNKKKMDAIVTN